MDGIVSFYVYEPPSQQYQAYNFYIDYTGQQAIDAAKQYLSIDIQLNYNAMIITPEGQQQWVDKTTTLRQQNAANGCFFAMMKDETQQNTQAQPQGYQQYQTDQTIQADTNSFYSADSNQLQQAQIDNGMGFGVGQTTDFTQQQQVSGFDAQQPQLENFDQNQQFGTFDQQQQQFGAFDQQKQMNAYGYAPESQFNTSFGFDTMKGAFSTSLGSMTINNAEDDISQFMTGTAVNFNAPEIPEDLDTNLNFVAPSAFDTNGYEIIGDGQTSTFGDEFEFQIDDQISQFQTMMGFGAISDIELKTANESELIEIETFIMFKSETGKKALYSKSANFEDTLNLALKTLGKCRDEKYALLITLNNGAEAKWFDEDKFLEDYEIVPGMEFHIFKAMQQLMVYSPHFDKKRVHIDITKKVNELVTTIGKAFDIDSYHCYTLCSMKDRNKPEFMSIEKSIPEQTTYLKEVLFIRQYHIYTLEDLATMKSAVAAFEDIRERADQCSLIMDSKGIIRYTALCAMSEKGFKLDKIPSDVSKWCPGVIRKKGKGASKGDNVRRFIEKFGVLDRFNAIREFIYFVRRIPGFDSHIFHCTVTVKYRNDDIDFDAIVDITPYRLLILNPNTKVEEERINFSEIILIQLLSTLEISFSPAPGRTAKYTFKGDSIESMYKLINRFREITNSISVDRAKNFSQTGDFQKLITDNGCIYLKTTQDLSDPDPREFKYDRRFNGLLMRTAAEHYLGLKKSTNHCIMVHVISNIYRWIKEEDILQTHSLQDGMVLYILDKVQRIRFIYPDGATKVLEIDISEPIEKLTKICFERAGLPVLLGYTFWCRNDKGGVFPLDSRYPIPEQCDNFRELFFQRRFFILSKEVLQSQTAALQTLHECVNYLFENEIQIPLDKALKLAINYIYATDEGNIRESKHNLKELLPPNIPVTKEIQKKFQEMLSTSADMTVMGAARKYIGIVRKLENFGVEVLKFKKFYDNKSYQAPARVVRKGSLVIGPFGVKIRNERGEELYPRFGYKTIKSWQRSEYEFSLTVKFTKTSPQFVMYFIFKDTLNADMLISYNIKLNHDLLILNQERTRKKEEEIAKRLKGGYKDEEGRIHGPMLDFRIGIWGDNSLKASNWFELSTVQEVVLEKVLSIVRHDENVKYAIMIQVVKGVNKWLLPGQMLKDVNPYRNAIIYLHPEILTIKIVTTSGQSVKMLINVTKTVSEVVEQVGERLHIEHPLGYTLFYAEKKTKQQIPLDIWKTIPEQTNNYNTLYFRRYFFVISKFDFKSHSSLCRLYFECKQVIMDGDVDMTSEIGEDLAFFSVIAENEPPVKPKVLPADVQTLFPPSIKYGKHFHSNLISKIKHNEIDNCEDGMLKYINLARSLSTFGATRHDVTYIEMSKDQIAEIPAVMLVGPRKVIVISKNLNKNLAITEYKHFIKVESTGQELMLKSSSDEDSLSKYILVKRDTTDEILSRITSHIDIIKRILLMTVPELDPNEEPNKSKERITLITTKGWSKDKREVNVIYDHRYSGKQLLDRARNELHLDTTTEYSPLLRLSNDEFRWIEPDDIIGTYFPCDGMLLQIFPTNVQIQVHLENAPTVSVLVDITRPLWELIPIIADRLFIEYHIGMTLYVEYPPHKPKALDLFMSLPEQVTEPTDFLIKRRFLTMTHYDRINPVFCASAYPDILKNVLSGVPVIEEYHATELAIYSIYANNTCQEPSQIAIPKDFARLYPKGTPKNLILGEKIIDYIRHNQVLPQDKAIMKYASIAKSLLHYGCEIYKCTVEDDGKIKDPQPIKISLGPYGFHLFGIVKITSSDGEIVEYDLDERIMYTYICEYFLMIDHIIIRVSQASGHIRTITLTSKKASTIFKLIRQYREILINIVQQREHIQEPDEELEELLNNMEGPIKIGLSRHLDHPNPPKYNFPLDEVNKKLIKLACYYLAIPRNVENYALLYRSETGNYSWMGRKQRLIEFNPTEESQLILLVKNPQITVMTIHDKVQIFNLEIAKPIIDNTKICCEGFQVGGNIGFTFYSTGDGDDNHPLDFTQPFAVQTCYFKDLLLKRRFLVWPQKYLEDPDTLFNIYLDLKSSILENVVEIKLEKAIEFAILSLFAENEGQDQNILSKIVKFKDSDFKPLFPQGTEITPTLIKKFNTMMTGMQFIDKAKAAKQYINKVIHIEGYGQEVYNCYFTNLTTCQPTVEATISLNPKRILVSKYVNTYAYIYYPSLISFDWNVQERVYTISYQDNEGNTITVQISEAPKLRDIDSYIRNIIAIYQMEEFEQDDELLHEEEYNEDDTELDDSDYNADTYMHTFQEMSTFDFDDGEFDYGQTSDDFNNNFRFNDFIHDNFAGDEGDLERKRDIEDDSLVWRANADGLNLKRAERMIDSLELQLNIPRDELDSMDPDSLFQQLATINDSLDLTMNEITSEDIRDQIFNIRSSIDAVCDTTQDIAKNEQEIHPYIDIILSQLQSVTQCLQPAKEIVAYTLNNFKESILEEEQQQNGRELPEIARDLICISEMQELLCNEILKEAGLLSNTGQDPSKIISSIQNTSTTLTALAGTIADAQNTSKFAPNILQQLIACKDQIQQVTNMVSSAESGNIDVSNIKAARDELAKILLITQQKLQKDIQSMSTSKPARFQIFLGNDKEIENLINNINGININISSSVNNNIIDSVKNSNSALHDITKQLEILKQAKQNDQVRLETTGILQHGRNVLMDTIDELMRCEQTQEVVDALRAYQNILNMINNQLDLISTKNITAMSVAKVNDDMQFILNRREAILNNQQLDNQQKMHLQSLFDKINEHQFNLQQQQSNLMTNVCSGETVENTQKILIDIKKELPELSESFEYVSQITNDPTLSVLLERLKFNLRNALGEPDINGENLSKYPYIAKIQESTTVLAKLINELVEVSDSPVVLRDTDMVERAKMAIEKAQEVYIDMIKTRCHALQDPYSKDSVEKIKLELERQASLMREVQLLSRRVADAAQNNNIEQMTSTIINNLEEIQVSIKGIDIKVGAMSSQRILLPPTPEDAKTLVAALNHLFQLTAYYANLPEVSSNPERMQQANADYQWWYTKVQEIQNMGNNPTNQIYVIRDELISRANAMQAVAMQIPSYAQTPNLKQSIPYALSLVESIKERYRELDMGSMDGAKTAVINVKPYISNLKTLLETVISSENVTKNKLTTKTITYWIDTVNSVEHTINIHVQSQNYTIRQAILDKEALITLQNKVNIIPINVRKTLNQDQVTNLTNAISSVSQVAAAAINEIRSIPTSMKIEIDMSTFPHINNNAEIEEAFSVVKDQTNIINDLLDHMEGYSHFMLSPNSQIIVKSMKESVKGLNLNLIDQNNEQMASATLANTKLIMPDLISKAELIAPITNSYNIVNAIKQLSDAASSLAKMLSVPHMNTTQASEFINNTIPHLQKLQSVISVSSQSQEVANSPILSQKIIDLSKIVSTSINELPSLKPRLAQQKCDDIYTVVCAALPTLYDSTLYQLEEAVDNVARITEVYTALPNKRSAKTAALILKKPCLSNEAISSTVDQVCNSLQSNVNEADIDVFDNLSENITIIHDHLDSVQSYLTKPVNALIPLLRNRNDKALIEAVRIVASVEPSWELRNEYLQKISISSAIDAAQTLSQIQTSVNYLQELISNQPDKFPQEVSYYNELVKRTMKNTDSKLLLETKSLPSAILNLESMHDALYSVTLLIDSIKDIEIARAIVNPLRASTKKYMSTLHQFDMSLYDIFTTQLDRIASACDLSNLENPTNSSEQIKGFIRKSFSILKAQSREISFGPGEMKELVEVYKSFIGDVYPLVTSMSEEHINEIQDALKKVEPIKSLINKWAVPVRSNDRTELRNLIVSITDIVNEAADEGLEKVRNNPEESQFEFSIVTCQLQNLQFAITQAKNIGVDTTKIDAFSQHLSQILAALGPILEKKNIENLQQAVQQIKQCMCTIIDSIKASCPVDYSDSSELQTTIKDINAEFYLASITDENSLAVGKTAIAILNSLKIRLESLKSVKAKTNADNKITPELVSVQRVQEESILTIELDPVMSTLSMDANSVITAANKSLQQGLISLASVPVFQHDKVSEYNTQLMIAQRIETIREFLFAEFPDVIKRLKKLDFVITEDMITDSIMTINSLTQQLNNENIFKESISRLTPNQVIVLQYLFNYTSEQLKSGNIKLPIDEALQSNQIRIAELIRSVIDFQASNAVDLTVKSQNEIVRAIARGFSAVKLIEALIAVQQQGITNSPEICKFVHSTEGEQAFTMPIEPSQILDVQQQILRSIDMSDSPENLKAYISTLSPEDLIVQQRIINATLNLLSSNKLFDILIDPTTETTHMGILKAANILLQAQLKEDKEVCRFDSLINVKTITSTQETLHRLLERMQAAQSLMAIQTAQEAMIPNLHTFNQSLDITTNVNHQQIKQYAQLILNQLDYLKQPQNFAQIISKMRPEDIQIQQVPITYLAGILATAPQEYIYPNNSQLFNTNANVLIDSIQEIIADNAADIQPVIAEAVPIEPIDVFTQNEKILQACSNTISLSEVYSAIVENVDQTAANSQALQALQKSLNDAKIAEMRNKMLYIIDACNQSKSELDKAVKELTDENKIIVFSLLTSQISSLKDIDKIIKVVSENSLQSRIFDYSLLIQAEPTIGIASLTSIQTLPDVAEVNNDIVKAYQALAEATMASNINTLIKMKLPATLKEYKEMQTLLSQQESVCTLEKIGQIQQSIYQQIYLAGTQKDALVTKLQKESMQDRVIGLALLHHLSMLANAPQYVMASSQGIKFLPDNTMDSAVVTNTTQVSAATIVSRLIQYQKMAFKDNPSSATKITLPLIPLVENVWEVSKETLERSRLRAKIITIQGEILTKVPEFATAVANARKAGSVKLNITPEEIKAIQSQVKDLVGSNISSSRILTFAKDNQSNIVKKIAILNNLVKIISPTSSIVSTFSDLSKFESIFKVNIDVSTIPTVISNVGTYKPHSELICIASAAQTASNLLPILTHISSLPLSECKRIFATENHEAIKIILKLMEPNTQVVCDNLVQQLSEIIPQLIASLSRVIVEKNNNPQLRELLIKDPAQILQITNEIQICSADLTKEDNAKRFRQMNMMMLQILKNLESALLETSTRKMTQFESLETCATFVKSVKTRNIPNINSNIIQLHADKIQNIASDSNNEGINEILAKITEIEPKIQQYYIVGANADSTLNASLQEVQNAAINIINKDTPNPFKEIEKISTIEELTKVFLDSRSNIESSTTKLIRSVKTRNTDASIKLISRIIKNVSDSQAAMFHGFSMANCSSAAAYTDYMTMIGSSMNTIHAIVDIGKTNAVSSTAIRHSTRSFNRMINSMIDMIEDNDPETFNSNVTSKLDKARLNFIKDTATGLQNVISTVAAKTGSQIPETFQHIMSIESQRLNYSIQKITESAETLNSVNTNKQYSAEFTVEFNSLISSLNNFQKVASQNTSSLDDVAQQLICVSKDVQNTLTSSSRLTDVIEKIPDLENADKLPQGFSMPNVPDTSNSTISEEYQAFEKCCVEYLEEEARFYQIENHLEATNLHFLQAIMPLYKKMDNLTVSLIAMSTMTLSLDYQQTLTNATATLVKSFDKILHSLKDKFLLRGDFDILASKVHEEIDSTIQNARDTAKKALDQAVKEESIHASIIAKYMELINPLKSVLALAENKNTEISKKESSISKELALSILKPCNGISQALNHFLLFSKSHTNTILNADEMLAKGSEIVKKLKEALDSLDAILGGSSEPEKIIATTMKGLSETTHEFATVINTNNTETKKLLDVIKNLATAANGLAVTSEQALQKKAQCAQKHNGGGIGNLPKSLPKASLLKRLELESHVLKARILLERSEKQIQEMN